MIMNYVKFTLWPTALLKWPSQSPDSNPVGNFWFMQGLNLHKRCLKPTNSENQYSPLQ